MKKNPKKDKKKSNTDTKGEKSNFFIEGSTKSHEGCEKN